MVAVVVSVEVVYVPITPRSTESTRSVPLLARGGEPTPMRATVASTSAVTVSPEIVVAIPSPPAMVKVSVVVFAATGPPESAAIFNQRF